MRRRAKNPQVLSDLVSGDCCIVELGTGTEEIQIGFKVGGSVFARVHDADVDQLLSFDGNVPFTELTYEQPSVATRANEILEEVDPVFGMGTVNDNSLPGLGKK
jgi:hypothetical protein